MSRSKNNRYSVAFKLEAVQQYLDGNDGYRKLSQELGLKDNRQLRNWVAKVKAGESLEDTRGRTPKPPKAKKFEEFSSLEEKLAYVEAERDYLKKLYCSRFGHEWGAHKKVNFSK